MWQGWYNFEIFMFTMCILYWQRALSNAIPMRDKIKLVADYIRSMKFTEMDWRDDSWPIESPNSYIIDEDRLEMENKIFKTKPYCYDQFITFPYRFPILQNLHLQVVKYCQYSVTKCINYLYKHIRNSENGWYLQNHETRLWLDIEQDAALNKGEEWLKLKKLSPFKTHLERMRFKVSASYFLCNFTFHNESVLRDFDDECEIRIGFKNYTIKNKLWSKQGEFGSWACAFLSFCPDLCCGEVLKRRIVRYRIALEKLMREKYIDKSKQQSSQYVGVYGYLLDHLIKIPKLDKIYQERIKNITITPTETWLDCFYPKSSLETKLFSRLSMYHPNPCSSNFDINCRMPFEKNRNFLDLISGKINYSCPCPQITGYAWESAFRKCIDINECLENKSICSAYKDYVCVNTIGSYLCTCSVEKFITNENCDKIENVN